MFTSVLTTANTGSFLLCIGAALLLGVLCAALNLYKNRSTATMTLTLALLPPIIALIIMLVNGNIGAGIAVAGAFSLVRFRSQPGDARQISSIFLAMALGFAVGMGYVYIALAFFAIMALFVLVLTSVKFGQQAADLRELKITIPENLDYDGLFDDLFSKYTSSCTLTGVKTTNMGTLFELHYDVALKGSGIPKEFLDELRCRNGNLTIVCGRKNTVLPQL
jgi:hypothetical protein